MPEPPSHTPKPGRHLGLAAVIVAVVAGIGFVTGTQSSRYQAQTPPPPGPRPLIIDGAAQPARTHAELSRRPWRRGAEAESGRTWDPRTAPATLTSLNTPVNTDRARIQRALSDRAERRAFDGAPPTIPHPVQQGGAAECLACHADGMVLGQAIATKIPHEAFTSCTQCHVVSASPVSLLSPNAAASAANSFAGVVSPSFGERAFEGAPPTVPHTTWLRGQCGACHGPTGQAALRTPHPERQSCLQCHAPSAQLDQRSRS
jgi:cytochrome c-type protein NapB